jgi:hypothetical protein
MPTQQNCQLWLKRWIPALLFLSLVYPFIGSATLITKNNLFYPGYSYRITPGNLFYIERNTDKNLVIYDANLLGNNVLNPQKPVKVYWIRNTEGAIKKDLSLIQTRMAYGIILKKVAGVPTTYEAKLAAYKERGITISYNDSGYPVALMMINGRLQQLHHIFIQVIDTQKFIPKIGFIQIFGKDMQTGDEDSEKIMLK